MLRSKRPKEPNPLKIIIFGEELVGKTCFIDMIWQCRNTVFIKDGAEGRMQGLKKRFGCVVVGNKKDIIDRDEGKRQVKKEMADQWASSQGFRHIEISSNERKEVEDAVQALVDSVQRARRMDAKDIRDSKSDVKGWSKKIGKHVING
ncbi:unnamed protein product [Alternaria alternata]